MIFYPRVKSQISLSGVQEMIFYSRIVLMFYILENNFQSVMPERFPGFLGWSSTKGRTKCLAKGHITVPTVSPRYKPRSF